MERLEMGLGKVRIDGVCWDKLRRGWEWGYGETKDEVWISLGKWYG